MRTCVLSRCFLPILFWGVAFALSGGVDAQPLSFAGTGDDQKSQTLLLFEQPGEFRPHHRIDELLRDSLAQKNMTPAPLCSDAVFVRRVYLDLIGTLPTVAEVRAFLDDTSPDKRNVLIDKLLDRPEFIDYWTMQWCDMLRVKAEFPINLWPNGALCYYNWIRDSVRTNKSYDQFAYELLTSNGSNFREGAANFYRAAPEKNAETLAEAVAQTFLGMRTVSWREEKRADLTVFFSRVAYKDTAEWKEEIVYWDRRPLEKNMVTFPDGTQKLVEANVDLRTVFADWLIAPTNTLFSRYMANRVWFWLLGRGLVHEPDDFRDDNLPVHPEILDYLAAELVRSRYDIKHLLRLIARSATYQQSSLVRGDATVAQELFAVYPIRRLEAEVLQDALSMLFGRSSGYNSEVPEPFTFIPNRYRTVVLPDSGITSPFLEMFGRPTRDTGLTSDRNNRVTEAQQLFLINSTEVNTWVRTLSQNHVNRLRSRQNAAGVIVDELWLLLLSRLASPTESRLATASIAPGGRLSEQKVQDLVWALLNTDEFLCRH